MSYGIALTPALSRSEREKTGAGPITTPDSSLSPEGEG